MMLYATNGGTFNITFTLTDLLLVILLLVAIVAIVYLIKTLVSVSKTLKNVAEIVENNKESIDASIGNLQGITNSTNRVLTEADELITKVKPDLIDTIHGVKDISINASKLTNDVTDTVEFLALRTADTVDNFSSGVSQATDYIAIVKSILESIKNVMK